MHGIKAHHKMNHNTMTSADFLTTRATAGRRLKRRQTRAARPGTAYLDLLHECRATAAASLLERPIRPILPGAA